MGKNASKLELPAPPTYQTDPTYTSGLKQLMGLGTSLTNGDFTGNLSWLADTTTINPDIIKGFFTGLQPSFQKMRQDTINTLAANNQLEGSTTANALTQLDQNISDTMMGKVADLQTQVLQNRLNLFGTGLNTLTTGTGMAQTEGQNLNNFNLANYENMVAKAMAEKKADKGGWAGGLTGAMGGAGLGLALAPFTGGASLLLTGGLAAAGGAAGAMGSPGTGGSILSAGSSAMGGGLTNRLSGTFNNPYRGLPGISAGNGLGSNGGYTQQLLSLMGGLN